MLKIDQLALIYNLLDKKDLIGYNLINIPIKTSNTIDINKASYYQEVDIKTYQ